MLPTLYMVFIIQLELNILLVYVLASAGHLRMHKFHHNLGDTTSGSCSCGKPETVEHYPLHCPNYTLIRSELFANLRTFISLLTLTSSSYTCNLLLFGNPNYDFYTNKKILEITICCITTSKRFLVPLIG